MNAPDHLQHVVEIEIPFHDCDPANIVWHGHYARYFEVARCALLERLGYNYDHMLDSGYVWPLIDFQMRFIQPLRFKQKVRVQVRIVEWEFRLKMNYLITDVVSNERLTKGSTTQVAVHRQTQEMCLSSPRILLEKLGVTT